MLSADRLREFQTVVESPSITAAARTLGMPRPTLSRRISGLEKELGVRLVQRTTRQIALTPAGAELYRRACRVVADTEAAWDAVRRLDETPRGPLRIAVPSTSLAASQLYLDFALAHPEVQLEVVVTPRDVDLIAEGIDVALCFGAIARPGLLVRRILNSRDIAVASPEYLAKHGTPTDTDDLKHHKCIAFFDGDRVKPVKWEREGKAPLTITPSFMTNSYPLMLNAALRGLGIAVVAEGAVQRQLDEGSLMQVLPDRLNADCPTSLVFVEREYQLPQVRAFIDQAVVFYRKYLTDKCSNHFPELY